MEKHLFNKGSMTFPQLFKSFITSTIQIIYVIYSKTHKIKTFAFPLIIYFFNWSDFYYFC